VAGALIASLVLASPACAQGAASAADANLRTVQAILQTPDAQIDLAKIELSIEHIPNRRKVRAAILKDLCWPASPAGSNRVSIRLTHARGLPNAVLNWCARWLLGMEVARGDQQRRAAKVVAA
jgi:hypothetical protein